MILLWLLLPLVPLVIALAIVLGVRHDYCDMWPIVAWIVAAVAAFGMLVPTIRQMDHHFSSNSCRQYGANIDREVRYITNSYWDYDCYVKTAFGWVKRDKITETELRGALP